MQVVLKSDDSLLNSCWNKLSPISKEKFCDPKLPSAERVADLLPRLSFGEKVDRLQWRCHIFLSHFSQFSQFFSHFSVFTQFLSHFSQWPHAFHRAAGGASGVAYGVPAWPLERRRRRWLAGRRLPPNTPRELHRLPIILPDPCSPGRHLQQNCGACRGECDLHRGPRHEQLRLCKYKTVLAQMLFMVIHWPFLTDCDACDCRVPTALTSRH